MKNKKIDYKFSIILTLAILIILITVKITYNLSFVVIMFKKLPMNILITK